MGNKKIKLAKKRPAAKKKTPKPKIEVPDHISHSQIQTGRCPLKYKLIRLTGQVVEDSTPAEVGKCVHDIIFRYTDFCVKNKMESDFETMERVINECCDEYELPEVEFIAIRINLMKFAEKGVEFNKILEYEKRETIEFAPGKFIQIVIDRTNLYKENNGSILEIIDFKNSQKFWTSMDVEEAIQFKIYKYIGCTFLYPGNDFVRVGVHHTRHNFTKWGELKKVKDCWEEFDATHEFLVRQHDRLLKRKSYEPSICEECWEYGGCAVMKAGKCKLFTKAAVKKMMAGTIEQKVAAVRYLEIEIKDMKSIIQNQFKDKTPRFIAGKEVGYKPGFSHKYKLGDFIAYCERHGMDYKKLTIAKQQAEKAINLKNPIRLMNDSEQSEIAKIQIETGNNKFNM